MDKATKSANRKSLPTPSFLPQTNIQFYAWAHSFGYSTEDIRYFSDIYRLSQELFGSQFRASGKPFTSHLIGTASATCVERPPAYVVGAALCHLPLKNGEFSPFNSSRAKLRLVDSVLGKEAMEVDQVYEEIQRSRKLHFDSLESGNWQPTLKEQYALLIWAANEVDDELDAGSLFAAPERYETQSRRWVTELTRRYDWAEFESLAQDVYHVSEARHWASDMASNRTSAYTINSLTGRYPIRTRIRWKLNKLLKLRNH